MTQRLRLGASGMAAFFGSAMFASFFGSKAPSRRTRLLAWGGVFLLSFFAITNALTSFLLMSQTRIVFDICQRAAEPGEVAALIPSFVWIFAWFFVIEPANEIGKMYFVLYWTKASARWFTENWVRTCGDGGVPPKGVSERIVDRTAEFTQLVADLYVLLCRSVVVIGAFTPMMYSLGRDLFPALLKGVEYISDVLTAILPDEYALSTTLVSALTSPGNGWLLYTVVTACIFETLVASRIGKPLPVLLDESRKQRAHFRSFLEELESRVVERASIHPRERPSIRAEARVRLDMWVTVYRRTFPRNLALFAWRSGNQQAWQFALLAGLGLLAAAKHFTLGTMSATIYAVNEMRGALLTISHSWPLIVRIQSLAMGLQELEHHIADTQAAPALQDAAE